MIDFAESVKVQPVDRDYHNIYHTYYWWSNMMEVYGNSIQIKQATKLGYIEIPLTGDYYVADFSYPTSRLRRGRAQGTPPGSVCPALTCGCENCLVVIEEVESEE
jgi:hypothetical protein